MTKHFIADVDREDKTRVIKWAKATFGQSKPEGVKISEMRWYKRDLLTTAPPGKYGHHCITRFYFKNEADLMFFKLKWA